MWTRFQTLMLREWMQHHKGWLLVMLVPPAIFLAILPFGSVEVEAQLPSLLIAAAALAMSAIAVTGISWGMAMLQLPGLVRRDQQDRSIEFWLSLPASHSESIAATLLVHALLVPLLALAVGTGLGFVIAAGLVLKLGGLAALAEVAWLPLLLAGLAGALRLALGLLLMSLWLAPLLMIPMVASAWLKRWGVPAVIAAVVIGGNVLDKVYGNPIVWTLLNAQAQGAAGAFFNHQGELDASRDDPESLASTVARWALDDSLSALQSLASPHLIGGLLVAVGCFALLVLRRRRAA
jgi:ABC-2 type transport system permease protein